MQNTSADAAEAVRAAIADAKPFRGVPEEARVALARSAHLLSLKDGATLFQHGEPGGAMFLVVSGLIEVSVITPDGRTMFLSQAA